MNLGRSLPVLNFVKYSPPPRVSSEIKVVSSKINVLKINVLKINYVEFVCSGRCSGLVISVLNCGVSVLGLSPGTCFLKAPATFWT